MKKYKFLLLLFFHSFLYTSESFAQDPEFSGQRVFRSMEEALLNPEQVYKLNLSRKKLDSIPPEVFRLTNLKELDLSKNNLIEIPAEIGQLVHLEKLILHNNDLRALPAAIGELTNLKHLGLNRNVITELPPEIGRLRNLEILELWDNELNDLPDEIAGLENLKVVELRGILFSDEQQARFDALVPKSAKLYMSPSCNCKN